MKMSGANYKPSDLQLTELFITTCSSNEGQCWTNEYNRTLIVVA